MRRILAMTAILLSTGCASLPANTARNPSTAFAAPEQTALGQLASARRAQAGARADSAFKLIDSVDAAFSSRLALIEGAQRSLDLQYYAVHADATTEILLQRLIQAARRGVRVRVLLDDFNTVGADAQVLRLAFEPNIEMRLFNPIAGPRGSLVGRLVSALGDVNAAQKRMHNKLFIADNAWGITGGRNLGDRYFGGSTDSNFVDLDVLTTGRIVRDMSTSFDHYWNDELAYPVQTLLSKEDLDRLREQARPANAPGSAASGTVGDQPRQTGPASADQRGPGTTGPPMTPPRRAGVDSVPGVGTALPPVSPTRTVLPHISPTAVVAAERAPMDLRSATLTWAPSRLMVDKPDKVGPGDDEADAGDTVVDGLLHLMGQARQDVLVISPYFVPGRQMMGAFAQLRQRGVRVRVLTNSLASNDAPAAHAGYARYRRELLGLGVELYEMRADPETAQGLAGSGSGNSGGNWGLGSGPGGSKAAGSRASLHSKAVMIDGRLSVIGSMNLDLRSKIQNSEVALVIRSAALTSEATRQVEQTFAHGAYRVMLNGGTLLWKAPPGAPFKDAATEPDASAKLRLLVNLIGPFAPDEML